MAFGRAPPGPQYDDSHELVLARVRHQHYTMFPPALYPHNVASRENFHPSLANPAILFRSVADDPTTIQPLMPPRRQATTNRELKTAVSCPPSARNRHTTSCPKVKPRPNP